MNLETLNLAEEDLLLRVGNVTGLIEEKHLQLEQNGVYAEYREIFGRYVGLIDSETDRLEALKRSTFLLWYEQTEPSCFTGLSNLYETIGHQKVYEALDHQVRANEFDLELKWMLPFYNGITEWVFGERAGLPNLHRFLVGADRELWLRELKAENFVGRGQMGNYWTSISMNAIPSGKNTV